MKLLEIEGKKLFKKAGITVPRDVLISSVKDISKIFAPCIVKAQVLHGHRGQQGLVRRAKTVGAARKFVRRFLRKKGVFSVVCENIVRVEKEYYLSLMVDGGSKDVIVIFSDHGGMDIEELAEKYPDEIQKFPVRKFNLKGVKEAKEMKKLVNILYELMVQHDAELIELNPLAVTSKGLVALDAKVVIDSKALYRQKEFLKFEHREITGRELKAAHKGLHYVDLDGDIGIIGDGAGLVMATLDTMACYGGKPANFLDVGGGAGEERTYQAMKIILSKKIKGLFINIFGGITLCDEIAKAIVHALGDMKVKIPCVVRLAGTNVPEGMKMLKAAGIMTASTMDAGVRRIVKLVK